MAVQGWSQQFTKRTRAKGAPKQYTFGGNYIANDPAKHEGDYAAYIHDDACERIIEQWIAGQYRLTCGHRAVIAYYRKRAALYMSLKEKEASLDPVKDYSEKAAINYKMKAIREDFYEMSKRHKAKKDDLA